ncbi:MAG: DDE-type integrase/transposase/recombinase [Chloroflexota bacterium]
MRTTTREAAAPAAPDRVGRQFGATGADRLWTGDITYIPTQTGFLFLAVVMDVHSRRIVGWAMANHLRTALVVQALEMALRRRRPAPGLIYHSDRGCQYTSVAFAKRCKQAKERAARAMRSWPKAAAVR